MIKHQASCIVLPVQVGEPMLQQSSTSMPLLHPLITRPRYRQLQQQQHLIRTSTSKSSASRRYLLQQQQHQTQQHQQQSRPKVIRASEYKNLRQVVPSLRRQRDIGKVEVVTEAARYIDHLHKTLIERFVLCGIPDSLKDILGTDNANELNSQHIMNLVTRMAAKKHQQASNQGSRPAQVANVVSTDSSAPRDLTSLEQQVRSASTPLQVESFTAPLNSNNNNSTTTGQQQARPLAGSRGNANVCCRRSLPIVRQSDTIGGGCR